MLTLNSLHKDSRGTISLIKGDELEYPGVTVFYTGDGKARGGCLHELNDEYTCVISGLVEYVIGNNKYILKDGDSMIIPRGTPHYFKSLTDSVVLEWGATEEEKKFKHAPTRAIVDEINDSSD
jgi:mannose-6-phosphate isomerase-like protein (cupin superfamily)